MNFAEHFLFVLRIMYMYVVCLYEYTNRAAATSASSNCLFLLYIVRSNLVAPI